MNEKREIPLNIRVTTKEKEMIESQAKKENRSITSFLVWLTHQFSKRK